MHHICPKIPTVAFRDTVSTLYANFSETVTGDFEKICPFYVLGAQIFETRIFTASELDKLLNIKYK
jgi:hypothetical protein